MAVSTEGAESRLAAGEAGRAPVEWPIFIAYRTDDGSAAAEWLYRRLHGFAFDKGAERVSLAVYWDAASPGVGDWTAVHRDALERARALVVVVTPGLAHRFGREDWVHRELSWWVKNRKGSPVIVDLTRHERWTPHVLMRRWPRAQRIPLSRETLAQGEVITAEGALVVERVVGGVRDSEERTIHEDLERQRAQLRRLRISLAVMLVALSAALSGGLVGFRGQRAARLEANHARQEVRRTRAASLLAVARAQGDPTVRGALLREVARPGAFGWEQDVFEAIRTPKSTAILRGRVVPGQVQYVPAVAFSPDGRRVAVGFHDGTARIWNADGSGEPVVLAGHKTDVASLSFSADGRRILTGSRDGTARLRNTDGTGDALVFGGGSECGAPSIAFSPDGKKVMTVGKLVQLWDVTGSGPPIVLGGSGLSCVASFSPDGRKVLVASGDQPPVARLWNADGSGQPIVLAGHLGRIAALGFSPDGTRVATGSQDKTVRVWNADGSGKPVVLEGAGPITSMSFSRDGRRVLAADGTAWLRNADGTGRAIPLAKEGGWDAPVHLATFSPDGNRVLTGDWQSVARLWTLRIHDERLYDDPLVFEGHRKGFAVMAFSPDGRQIVTGAYDGTARVWRADGGGVPGWRYLPDQVTLEYRPRGPNEPAGPFVITGYRSPAGVVLRRFEGAPTHFARFSPDAKQLLTVSTDGRVRVWHTEAAQNPVTLSGEERSPSAAAFSADGKQVVVGSELGHLQVWATDGSGQPVALGGHTGKISSCAFSVDGKRILTGSHDGTARLWNAAAASQSTLFRGHQGPVLAVAIARDGSQVITGSEDRTARIWKTDGQRDSVILRGYQGPVLSVEISPDGSQALTLTVIDGLWLWNANGSGPPVVLPAANFVAFDDDGRTIVTGTGSGWADNQRLWPRDFLTTLWLQTPFCLPQQERATLLNEEAGDAQRAYQRCLEVSRRCRSDLETCARAVQRADF
jgi:WD40 repeat protein